MAQAPKPSKPRLEDPSHIQEVFASDLAAIEVSGGVAKITFANIRHEPTGVGAELEAKRIVSARIVVNTAVLADVMHSIQQLEAVIRNKQAVTPDKKN